MKVTPKKNTAIGGLLILSLFIFSSTVNAQELTITGNGADSTSTVNATSTQQANVQQSNDANINNNIDTSANTGNNSASGNTNGDGSITTGNVSADTSVSNEANKSAATIDNCCVSPANAVISGNGAGSDNAIRIGNNSHTTITSDNNADITNIVNGLAVTGENRANDNTGDVSIHTGDINVREHIKNGPINLSKVHAAVMQGNEASIKIMGNGSDSRNEIHTFNNIANEILLNNEAAIRNLSNWDLETGNNTASNNVGDVAIVTGDIQADVNIENGPININDVTVTCACEKAEKPPVKPVKQEVPQQQQAAPVPAIVTPAAPAAAVSAPAAVPEQVVQQVAAAVGNILPVTGNNWLFFALLANIIMLLMGAYLRLRSGNSPGKIVAAI